MPARRPLALLLAAAALAAAAGCGFGAGGGDNTVRLTVSRDFGARVLAERTATKVPASETVMRLLQRDADVSTRFGGGFVQCIDRLCGSGTAGRTDWFYFVNGVEADRGATALKVRAGDRIWWDRRGWDAAQRVPAVVGAFPEPFVHGYPGNKLPVRVECIDLESAACEDVQDALVREDIPANKATFRTAMALSTLRVLVGPWKALRIDDTAALLEGGPGSSGVYAEPRPDGREIALLGPDGRRRRTLGPGAGLVAATRNGDDPPVWLVTGTDAAGVSAAAAGLRAAVLGGHYAVAFAGGTPLPLPLTEAGGG